MPIALLKLKAPDGDVLLELRDDDVLFAGRSAECDLCLRSPAVSRKHAVFLARRGQCGIKDLDSANGTFLNGDKLTRPVRLRDGDRIQIADFVIEFAVPGAPVPDDAMQTAVLSPDEMERLFSRAETRKHSGAKRPSVRLTPATSARIKPASDAPPETEDIAAKITSDSQRIKAAKPAAPTSFSGIHDDEIGDGAEDASFMERDDQGESDDSAELAMAQAAAEAGIFGEFSPDLSDTPSPEEQEASDAPPPAAPSPMRDAGTGYDLPDLVELPEPEDNPNAIPVDDAFRDAIEARLYLYAILNDTQMERDRLRSGHPDMPEAVANELDRQDRETLKPPPPDKAEAMIEKRMEKRRELREKIAEAKIKGAAPPPRPSRLMREAEEIAINQWTILSQSAREALPAVYREGFRLGADEPLATALGDARIDATVMMGGGAYFLALERLREEARYNRAFLRNKLAGMRQPEERDRGGGGILGLFGKKRNGDNHADVPAAPGKSYDELREAELHLANRIDWIERELALLEPQLVREFWDVYTRAALHYVPRPENVTTALRAFLRHGAIGLMPWWLPEEAREHILRDCTEDVAKSMAVSGRATNVLYADEYLAAVVRGECTPALDENLEIHAKNSPEWKADKALRRAIGCRTQRELLDELADSLSDRIEQLEKNCAETEARIAALLPGIKNFKQMKSGLMQTRQGCRVEISKLTKLTDKIRNTTIPELEEMEAEVEERFDSGELPRPEPDFLIRRECEALRKIGRLLSNLKERFMPLVLRDSFLPGTDAVNDRPSILGELAEFERRDPGIFLKNLVASKKRQNRVDLRVSPVVVLIPAAGLIAFSWNPRQGPESGRLAIPTCFIRQRLRERQITYLLSDFRWDTSKASAGMDVMGSETIVAAFMGVRWDWRKRSREAREKGLVFTDQNDRTNWRRVYEAYVQTAGEGGKKLYNRNYDFYERIVGKYFDLPEGVDLLRK